MKLPFEIELGIRKPLSQQATDGFRSAIKEGFYRDGEPLPALRSLSEAWGVSVKVPGRAYARLADEGYVVLHPGRGAFARRSGVRTWNGNVLFVSVGSQGGFFMPNFIQSLRRGMEDANMRFYTAVVPTPPDGEGPDFASFASYLNHPYDIVILMTDNRRLRAMVRSGVPRSLVVGRDLPGKVSPDVVVSLKDAERAFVEDCRRAGVRRVRIMAYGRAVCHVERMLRAAGVQAETVRVNPLPGGACGEAVQRAAHDCWANGLPQGKNRPDLVYFADDNLALGSLVSFAEQRIRVPDDVFVVTHGNRGSALPFACDLARIEVDPFRLGRETARRALSRLKANDPSALIVCEAEYRRGASFPAA